jgi:hypothetical protein
MEFVQQVGAIALLLAAFAACASALASRSFFVLAVRLAAGAALCAAGLASAGAGTAAMAIALGYAIVCPIVLLTIVVPGARAAKTQATIFKALPAALAATVLGVVIIAAPQDLHVLGASLGTSGGASWIAALLFAAATGCTALLGYGERGVLGAGKAGREHAAR